MTKVSVGLYDQGVSHHGYARLVSIDYLTIY